MEPIIDYLKRRLKEVGSKQWQLIATEISKSLPEEDAVGEALLRKIAYGDRENPGVKTIQPVFDFFQALDRGEISISTDPTPDIAHLAPAATQTEGA